VLARSCRLVRISSWGRGAREVLGCEFGIVRKGTEEASRYPDEASRILGLGLQLEVGFLDLDLARAEGSTTVPVVFQVEYKDRAISNPDPDPVGLARLVLGVDVGRAGELEPDLDLDLDPDLCLNRVRKGWKRRAGNRTVHVSPSLDRRRIFDSGQAVQVDSAAALQTEFGIDFGAAAGTELAVAVDDDRLRLAAAQLGRCQDDYQYHLTGNSQVLLLSRWDVIERTW
jgi:hypothetical protein